jgi:hypothetical protein
LLKRPIAVVAIRAPTRRIRADKVARLLAARVRNTRFDQLQLRGFQTMQRISFRHCGRVDCSG